jgi:ATP-dependent DNA helicase RecG
LREALVNSLCHRDYNASESNYIAVFKNRIEVINPGGFPEGKEPEDFIHKEERSILRNPLIADIFYRTKDIEKWGSGLRRIFNECKEKDVDVEFKKMKDGFKIIFYRREEFVETREKTREKIIRLIRNKPSISTKQLSEETGISEKGIEWNIKKMKEEGILKRVGPDKGGHWEVLEK